MNEYYFECASGYHGWKKAQCDHEVRNLFRFHGSAKVWKVARNGVKTLVYKQNNNGKQLPLN